MNSVIIPDDDKTEPDELLVEFAQRGNRAAIIEEIYRRANNHPSGFTIAQNAGVNTDDIESVADAAWKEYRNLEQDESVGERMMILEMSYGHVADDVFEKVETATNPVS